jgi:hypothetical protein
MGFKKNIHIVVKLIAFALIFSVLSLCAAATPQKKGAPKTTVKINQALPNPVTDSAPPIYVPVSSDDAGADIDLQPYLDPSLLDPELTPLSIPSSELGDVLPHLVTDIAPATGFDPIVLTDLRKKIEGTIIFEDNDRNIMRVRPKSSGPQRLFHGTQPAADSSGKRLIYVDWDLKSFFLYVFDLSSMTRKKVYTSPNLLSAPSFSPDGKYAAFTSIPLEGGAQFFSKLDLATGNVNALAKNFDFYSYT